MVLDEAHVSRNGTTFPRGFARDDVQFDLVRAGDLVTLHYGKSLIERERTAGSVPVYGTNGCCGWNDKALGAGPTVILGRKGMGPLGVEWCEGPFWVIDTAYYVTPNGSTIDLYYFYYLIKYIGLNHLKDGTSNPSLSRETFYAQLLPLPTFEEQRKIAGVFRSLDDKIDLNRRMNETLEAIARTLFKSWFVDFDPVRAKMEGRQPAGMDAETAALFPDSFKDSPLGPIPNGWSDAPFLQVAELISGGTPSTSEPAYWGGGIPWASAKDVSQCADAFLIVTDRTISDAGLSNSATKIVPKFTTVVVARGATTGRFAMFGRDIAMNQTCYGLRSRDGQHFYFNCLFHDLVGELVHAAHGSVFDTITTTTFEQSRVAIPPLPIRQAFERCVESLFLKILLNVDESGTLAALRDALLPKLLSGEIRVNDAEPTIEEI